jgi:hypothetical protein
MTGKKLLLCIALAATACGSSDGGTQSPPEQCDELLNTYCGRVADCIAQLGCDPAYTREQENQACLTSARQTIACGNAKAVGASYSACLNAARSTACTAFGTSSQCATPGLPADCKSVILF